MKEQSSCIPINEDVIRIMQNNLGIYWNIYHAAVLAAF